MSKYIIEDPNCTDINSDSCQYLFEWEEIIKEERMIAGLGDLSLSIEHLYCITIDAMRKLSKSEGCIAFMFCDTDEVMYYIAKFYTDNELSKGCNLYQSNLCEHIKFIYEYLGKTRCDKGVYRVFNDHIYDEFAKCKEYCSKVVDEESLEKLIDMIGSISVINVTMPKKRKADTLESNTMEIDSTIE